MFVVKGYVVECMLVVREVSSVMTGLHEGGRLGRDWRGAPRARGG